MDVKIVIVGLLFILFVILSDVNAGDKKIVIHIPYKIKNIKHTHTVYKTIHHGKKPETGGAQKEVHHHHHHHHHHHEKHAGSHGGDHHHSHGHEDYQGHASSRNNKVIKKYNPSTSNSSYQNHKPSYQYNKYSHR